MINPKVRLQIIFIVPGKKLEVYQKKKGKKLEQERELKQSAVAYPI